MNVKKWGWALLALSLVGCGTTGSSVGTPTAGMVSPLSARPVMDMPHNTPELKRAKAHVELGMAYTELGKLDVALDEAQAALQADSSYSPAYHLLGLTYMLLKDSAAARANFEKALDLAPGDPDVNNTYGMFMCQNGEVEGGLSRLSSSARNPYYKTPTRPYTNGGLCYLSVNNEAAAVDQFRRAVQADPTNTTALYHLANIAYRNGDYAESHKSLVQLHQNGTPTAASVWLGYLVASRLRLEDERASYAAQLKGRFPESNEYKWLMQGKSQ